MYDNEMNVLAPNNSLAVVDGIPAFSQIWPRCGDY